MPRRTWPARLTHLRDEALAGAIDAVRKVVGGLPPRAVLALADAAGEVLHVFDRRGRRVARQNLDVAFGDGKTAREKRAISRASARGSVRAVLLLFHATPFTRRRVRRWLHVPSEVKEAMRRASFPRNGGVLVSGHVGAWELLLGVTTVLDPDLPSARFVVESMGLGFVDRWLSRMRGSAGLVPAPRKGAALALRRAVADGDAAALLADRNARGDQGGVYAPFLGLLARTTALPARLAVAEGVPLHVVLALPEPDGTYRLWFSPNLAATGLPADADAAVLELTTRVNAALERVVRAAPEAWNWTLKRFKSRPTPERGPYPAYSLYDPVLRG